MGSDQGDVAGRDHEIGGDPQVRPDLGLGCVASKEARWNREMTIAEDGDLEVA